MQNLFIPDLAVHDLSSDFLLLSEQLLADHEDKVSVGTVWRVLHWFLTDHEDKASVRTGGG